MGEINLNVGSAVPTFIEEYIAEVEDGLNKKGYKTCTENEAHIKLELYATEVKEGEAGLKIRVLSLGGKKSDSNAQKMMVFAKKNSEVEEAENKVKIAEAQAKEKLIKKMGLSPNMINKMK